MSRAPYREPMAGTPDVLTSPPASPRRRWLTLGVALAAVSTAATLALVGGDADDASRGTAPVASSVPPADPTRPTSTTIDPADLTTGSAPAPAGLPNGTAAVAAARTVADTYCDRISGWRLTIDGEDGEYLQVVVLLRPAGPAYPDVVLRIELTWTGDHYDWAASRTALESCP